MEASKRYISMNRSIGHYLYACAGRGPRMSVSLARALGTAEAGPAREASSSTAGPWPASRPIRCTASPDPYPRIASGRSPLQRMQSLPNCPRGWGCAGEEMGVPNPALFFKKSSLSLIILPLRFWWSASLLCRNTLTRGGKVGYCEGNWRWAWGGGGGEGKGTRGRRGLRRKRRTTRRRGSSLVCCLGTWCMWALTSSRNSIGRQVNGRSSGSCGGSGCRSSRRRCSVGRQHCCRNGTRGRRSFTARAW